MNTVTLVIAILVALEHLYIMFLETFATTSSSTSRVFCLSKEQLKSKPIATLLKNQGVYNGLLAVMIVIAVTQNDIFWLQILFGYIVLAAFYGGITSNPSIIIKQGGLAILGFISTFF